MALYFFLIQPMDAGSYKIRQNNPRKGDQKKNKEDEVGTFIHRVILANKSKECFRLSLPLLRDSARNNNGESYQGFELLSNVTDTKNQMGCCCNRDTQDLR